MTDNQELQDEVFRLKQEGLTNKEISSRLEMNEKAVEEIIKNKPPDVPVAEIKNKPPGGGDQDETD